MKLIIGLGNPGKKYQNTRHNAGFMALDAYISKLPPARFSLSVGFKAKIYEAISGDVKIIMAKPQTFMNNSGKTTKKICDYYKISADNIIVVHDDLDIPLGEYKTMRNRGSAGHKGVKSIIEAMGTKDFWRIRIGIMPVSGKPPVVENFVLESFTEEEKKKIDEINEKVCKKIDDLIIPRAHQ